MKTWSSREILQVLQQDGWQIIRQRGSHLQLKHLEKLGKVTVPHPRSTLNPKTAKSIFRQAGIDMKEI